MALNKGTLKAAIIDMLNDLINEEDQPAAIERFADQLSDAVDSYVRDAQVIGTDSNGGPINGSLV